MHESTEPAQNNFAETILIAFHGNQPDADGTYVNVLMQYVHEAALGMRPATLVEHRGNDSLVLLPIPVLGWDLDRGTTIRFSAALLHLMENGQVEGWLVRDAGDAHRLFHDQDARMES